MPLADSHARIESTEVSSYTIPTDKPESDGTLSWRSTTLVLVRVGADGRQGLGYGYADTATARLIGDKLLPLIRDRSAFDISGLWHDMSASLRNLGRPGICAMAVSVVDNALWDLKARILDLPLASLLGSSRPKIAIYGSGGFTSYSIAELEDQLGGWADRGIGRVKMKIGRRPADDVVRVAAVARRVGKSVEVFVDANGAYARKQALSLAERFAEQRVCWFEEPVSSDDLAGLRLLRDRAPAGMAIAAGEYGYDLTYFRRMLEAQAVDVLQADATRCGGITGFLGAAALCESFSIPLSAHCAPSLHAPLCCAVRPAVHLEYFHDHSRIEHMLFDGAPTPVEGCLPAGDAPGLGLDFQGEGREMLSGFIAERRAPQHSTDAAALADELSHAISGEVRFDAGSRALYATDGSNYRQTPIGVVIPKTVEEVVRVVEICRLHQAPVLSRGGGTSLCGQCCNVAVVIDFSKYLNRVLEIDPAAKTARVEPGVVLDVLRHAAQQYGLTFAPDPGHPHPQHPGRHDGQQFLRTALGARAARPCTT